MKFNRGSTFIKAVRDQVTPGTSRPFVMSSDAVPDKVREAFKGNHPDLIHASLSADDELKLREIFAED